MMIGMATKKITVTIPDDQLDSIRALVEANQAASVSGFVQHAIRVALDDVAGWEALLEQSLEESGGPLTDEERRWANEMLGLTSPGESSAA